MARLAACVNAVLDRSESMGRWFPALAGALLGGGIDAVARQGEPWGWVPLGAGLLLAAVRPAGTTLRARRRIAGARAFLDIARKITQAGKGTDA